MKRRAKKITSLPLKFRNKLTLPDRPTRPVIIRNMKTDGAIWTNDPAAAEVQRAQKSISTLKNMGFNLSADATREIFQRMTGRSSAPSYIMPDEERRMKKMAEMMGLALNKKNEGETVTVNERVGQPVTVPHAQGPTLAAAMAMAMARNGKEKYLAQQLFNNATTHVVIPTSKTGVNFPTAVGKPDGPDMNAGARAAQAGVSNTKGNEAINGTLIGDPLATATHLNDVIQNASGEQDIAAANKFQVKSVTLNLNGTTQPMDPYYGISPNVVESIQDELKKHKEKYEKLKEEMIEYYRKFNDGDLPSPDVLKQLLGMAEPTTTEKPSTVGIANPVSAVTEQRTKANEALARKQSGFVRSRVVLTDDESEEREPLGLVTDEPAKEPKKPKEPKKSKKSKKPKNPNKPNKPKYKLTRAEPDEREPLELVTNESAKKSKNKLARPKESEWAKSKKKK